MQVWSVKAGEGPSSHVLRHVVSPSALNAGTKRLEITRRIRHCSSSTYNHTLHSPFIIAHISRAPFDTMEHLPDELVLHIISCTFPEIAHQTPL
jgi:hypothetical protein